MGRSTVVRRDVHWVDVDDDVVAVDPADGSIHLLRGATAVVWRRLDGSDVSGMEYEIAEASGIPAARAARDIREALAQLEAAGLVVADQGIDGGFRSAPD